MKAVVTFISESNSTRLISHESAFEAVRKALIAAASADAKVFPAVIAHASAAQNTFSLKSGSTPELAGLKVGSFWPDNPAKGRPRHSSTIFLIDQDNGRIGAVIEASLPTPIELRRPMRWRRMRSRDRNLKHWRSSALATKRCSNAVPLLASFR